MKRTRLIRSTVSLLWTVAATGCSSLSGYLVDRGRDAADVLTVTMGGGALVQIRLGPLPIGLLDTGDIVGLRYGEAFCREPNWDKSEEHDVTLATVIAAPVVLVMGAIWWDRNNEWPLGYFEKLDSYRIYENNFPLSETQLRRNKGTGLLSSPNCYQVEGVIGLGVIMRAGVNAGELLDFMLGWSTLDIFEDDVGLGWKSGSARGYGSGPAECDVVACPAGRPAGPCRRPPSHN